VAVREREREEESKHLTVREMKGERCYIKETK
jgi:hypothetical protein